LSRNLQPAIHPDADQLSVFVEGAATARERERMLAHLAECGECRKAVFLMQPHQEPQRVTATPEKGWIWRWLVPVGVPAAALACALLALLIHIRPQGTPATPQQMASARPPETERPGTTVAPTTSPEAERGAPSANADRKASINSAQVAQSEGRQNGLAAKAAANIPGQQRQVATDLNLPANKSGRASAVAAPQITVGGPITSVQTSDSTLAQSTVSTSTTSNLPLNGRNFAQLQQLPPTDKGAASQNTLAKEKEQPALQIQGASGEAQTLAGIFGRITDPTGAVIAGATVTVRDAAGKTRQTKTGADGSFHLTQLPAGQYGLTATATGFKTSNQSIELKPSEMAMLQPKLDVGAASEAVEVTGSAPSIQTDSANVIGHAGTEKSGVRRAITPPSGVGIAETVSHGKRSVSLDDAGNLFLSRNGGKKWKKVKPQWTGKAIRIESTSGSASEAAPKTKNETSGAAGEGPVFLLTTDGGTVWSSKDGAHWHQQ
jgi:Carboxypeptidase regulatory-like domain/Putative zinc-finger